MILVFIKLKIETGHYKRSYVVVKEYQTQFFISMETEIERENNGDRIQYKGIFRCNKVTSETYRIFRAQLLN